MPDKTTQLIITGAARSGTTAMAALLSKSPTAHIWNELGYFAWDRYPNEHRLDHIINEHANVTVQQLEQKSVGIAAARQALQLAHSSRGISTYTRNLTGARVVGDKYPPYVNCLDRIMDENPEVKVIFMVRDGRDVLISRKRKMELPEEQRPPWATYDPAEEPWLKACQMLEWVEKFHAHRVMRVHYEDMCEHFDNHLLQISEFLECELKIPADHGWEPTHVYGWKEADPAINDEISDTFRFFLQANGYWEL